MNRQRSRFWFILIRIIGVAGVLASVIFSLLIPTLRGEGQQICEVTRDSLKFGYLTPVPEVFTDFVNSQNTLAVATRIESTKACRYLEANWPLFYNGVGEAVEGGRDWPLDILRRIGVAAAGFAATFLILLTFVFRYQSILTLEEIRDAKL